MKTVAFGFLAAAALLSGASQPVGQECNTICSAKEMTERFIDVEQGQLFCRIMGQGEPLVVVHGGPGLSQDYLLPQLKQLAKKHLVIFYDQRGSGQSTGSIDPKLIQMRRFVDDLEQLRQTLGFNKISILGHSFGGLLAMRYAIAHPHSVDKLVLLSPAPSSSEDHALFSKEVSHRLLPHSQALAQLRESKPFQEGDPVATEKFFKTLFGPYCFNTKKVDELHLISSQKANINGSKTYAILNRDIHSQPYNLQAELQNLSCKTLIIHGDADPMPLSTAQNTHRSIPTSKLVVIKDCGHFPYVETPEDLFTILEAFLN
jgi:proline iminopeptidase